MPMNRSSRFAFEWTPARRRRVELMLRSSMVAADMARSLGCSKQTVLNYLDSPAKDYADGR